MMLSRSRCAAPRKEIGRQHDVSAWTHEAAKGGRLSMDTMGHVWTAPGWQGESSLAALVGAAMCSAFSCGTHDRWP